MALPLDAVVHGVGVAQYSGFQELPVGRIVDLLGLQQRQKFLGCNLFPRLVGRFFEHRVLERSPG